MQKRRFTTQRLVMDAVLIALFYVISLLKIPPEGQTSAIKISFEMLPVLLAALAFGPVDGLLVGAFGKFLEQLLSSFGLTPTTILWMLPAAATGLLVGLLFRIIRKPNWLLCAAIFIVSGIAASLLNTLAYYIDSKMFHYYEYHMVFGMGVWRLVKDAVVTPVLGFAALLLAGRLRKAGVIKGDAQ